MKVTIVSVHYNKPEFLLLQYTQLKKHCKDDWKLIILNNGRTVEIRDTISSMCKILGIQEMIFEQKPEERQHYCSHDHIMALEYLYTNCVNVDTESDIRVTMDSDVFAYRDFSFDDIMGEYHVVGFSMLDYFSAIFVAYRKNVDLTNFNINAQCADSGSGTGYLINPLPGNPIYYTHGINITAPVNQEEANYIFHYSEGAIEYQPRWIMQFLENCFIHYYRGTGWECTSSEYHQSKFNFVWHLMNNTELYGLRLDKNVCYDTAHVDQWIRKDRYRLNLIK